MFDNRMRLKILTDTIGSKCNSGLNVLLIEAWWRFIELGLHHGKLVACRIIRAKHLPELLLIHCQMDRQE